MKHNRNARWLVVVLCSAFVSQGTALEPEQIWELVSPSCVRIEATQLDGTKTLGTGFAFEIDGKKYILSNRHVVLGASRVQIGHSASNLVQAPSYRICPSLDFAVIDVPQKFTIAAAKKRLSPLKTGERAYAIGFPLGLNKSITLGLINSHGEEYVQFDASISSGNSGGPLVDKDGAVIGVVTAGARAEEGEIVQNLNVAINIAYVPKARVFVDPIVSFYDAWRQFVQFESRLIDDLQRLKVMEVHEYLMFEMGMAKLLHGANAPAEAEVKAEVQLRRVREHLLQPINQTHKIIDSAVPATVSLLRRKVAEFDEVPKLFIGLGRQPLLERFIKEERTDLTFRLNIDMEDIVPLLNASLERVKAKYEDMAYQVEFLGRNRSRLINRDAAFCAKLVDENRSKALKRNSIRINYPLERNGNSEESEMKFFFLSMQWVGKPTSSQGPTDPWPSTPIGEHFSEYGGFETHILGLFNKMAIDAYEKTGADPTMTWHHLDQALGLIRNEIAHRKFPDWINMARILVCRGDFEGAYKTYEKALYVNEKRINPFTLERERDKIASVSLDLGDVSTEQHGYASSRFYAKAVQENWKEWSRFIFTKGGLSMADFATPQEVFASQAFGRLSDFEKARVIYRVSRAVGNGKSFDESLKAHGAFLETVRSAPAARAVHEKYFEGFSLALD